MEKKSWNVRDQTEAILKDELKKCYEVIKKDNKLVTMAASITDAQYYVEHKFRTISRANTIELELLRRKVYETQG